MREVSLDWIEIIRKNHKKLKKIVYVKKVDDKYYRLEEKEFNKKDFGRISCICSTCDNAYFGKCPKIGQKTYRRIEKYPFMKEAIEIIGPKFNSDCNVIPLVCENYEKDKKRPGVKKGDD